MRQYRRRFAVAASVGVAAALLVTACSSSSNANSKASSAASGPELTHVTVGVLPVIGVAPFFVAQKEGFFKQEGLTVKPVIIQQSIKAVPDMIHGNVDIISGNYVSFLQGIAKGTLKIKVIAAGMQCAANTLDVLAPSKSHITKPADLAGKTIAVNLPNDIQTLTINAVLKADNVNPASVKYVQIKFPDMATAMATKQVDTIATLEPFITSIEERAGAVPVLDECQGPTANIPISGYFATQSWVQKYPKTALAFQRALEKGAAAADANRKLVDQVLPTYTKVSAKTAAVLALPNYPSTLDSTQLQRLADLMYSGGLLKSKFQVASIILH